MEENYETLEGVDALLKRPERRLFRRLRTLCCC